MSTTLQSMLADIQKSIEIYHALPKRKQRRRKYWDAYVSCVRMEMLFQSAIEKQEKEKK